MEKREKKKEEERKREKERKEEEGMSFLAARFVLLRRNSKNKAYSPFFFQGKRLNFIPINSLIICWEMIRIYFLIYFMKNG